MAPKSNPSPTREFPKPTASPFAGRTVTRYDLAVAVVAILGLLCEIFVNRLGIRTIVGLFFFGLFFELITKNLWLYNLQQRRSVFTISGTLVSYLAALGWVGLLSAGISLNSLWHHFFPALPSFWVGVLGLGLLGNLVETLYWKLGYFEYNEESRLVRGFLPRLVRFIGVPVSVRLGYFLLFPWLVSFITWFFAGHPA